METITREAFDEQPQFHSHGGGRRVCGVIALVVQASAAARCQHGADGRLAYVDEGEGPPVLLIHGHTLDLRVWDAVVEELVAAELRAIRYDLRGHGRSERPERGYHLADHAADAAGRAAGNFPTYRDVAAIDGPWQVAFDARWVKPLPACSWRSSKI